LTLAEQCRALLEEQRSVWPRLAQGCDALGRVETRIVELNAWPVTVQFNPARAASSLAKVDAASIAQRPCFLCVRNSPAEQRGLLLGDYVFLANPMPIVPGHLTVAHVRHVPQSYLDHLDEFLFCCRELDEGYTLYYNGPQCGASAPDHMHWQAAPSGSTPIERCLDRGVFSAEVDLAEGTRVSFRADANDDLERTRLLLIIRGRHEPEVARAVRAIVAGLPRREAAAEPLINVFASYRDGLWTVAMYPRAVHRPACFFAEEPARMLLSPGIMDMAGLLITVRREDFDRADRSVLAAIYREVTCSPEQCLAALSRLRS
jgi:hypothetical protein